MYYDGEEDLFAIGRAYDAYEKEHGESPAEIHFSPRLYEAYKELYNGTVNGLPKVMTFRKVVIKKV